MELRQRQLLRRMVLASEHQHKRVSTEEENKRMRPLAISTMVYTAVLNGFVFDLFEAIKAEPNAQKYLRIIGRIRNNSNYAHEKIYKVFNANIPDFGIYYNAEYDRVTSVINDNVYLEGVERYYNIVLALIRITKHFNEACGRWKSPAVCDLYRAERWLTSLGIPCADKSEVVEAIIKSVVTIQMPNEE